MYVVNRGYDVPSSREWIRILIFDARMKNVALFKSENVHIKNIIDSLTLTSIRNFIMHF